MSRSISTALPNPNQRLDIQGLRALAVLIVIAFHLGLPVSGGFIGVDIFFVISGFVITAMLEREWQSNQKISIRNFFIRRFWRLTPALSLVVATTFICGICVLSAYGPSRLMMLTGLGAVTLSANAVIAKFTGGYFNLAADTNPLLNTWSLSVEEQFYIGFLFILIFGWLIGKQIGRPKAAVLISVGTIFFVSILLAFLAQPGHLFEGFGWLFHFYSPINRAWEFAAGSLLALTLSGKTNRQGWHSDFVAFFGLGLILYSILVISEDQAWPSVKTSLPVVATLLLLWSGNNRSGFVYRSLASKTAVFIGDRSYSLYLWHWPLIVICGYFKFPFVVNVLLVTSMTFLLSAASYRWVESPLRFSRPSHKGMSALLAMSILAAPIVLGFGVYAANENSFWNKNLAKQKSALAKRHAADKNGCNKKISYLHRSSAGCTWNGGASGQPIYLVGDSNAAHYSDGFIAAAKQTNHPLITAVGAGCPFLLTDYEQPERNVFLDGNYRQCSKYSQETYEWLKSQPRGLIVISNSESYETVESLRVIPKGSSAAGNYYSSMLNDSVNKLMDLDFKVAVILGPPHFDARASKFPKDFEWDPTKCTLISELNAKCKSSIPVSIADELQSDLRTQYTKIATKTGVHLIDISRFFCTKVACPTQSENLQIYRDRSHTTYEADIKLIPEFTRQIGIIFKSE